MIEREDGHIYWSEDAKNIYNRWRALTPWPGIFSYWKNDLDLIRLKLISVELQKMNPQQEHSEGEVFEIGDDIGVQTTDGVIILKEIQKEGKKPVSAKEFINGYPNFIGSILQ
jgi:methionyl-tRNA formyltransferase